MMPKTTPKSMENLCWIYAWKNDAKMIEKGAKMESQRGAKIMKNMKNDMQK